MSATLEYLVKRGLQVSIVLYPTETGIVMMMQVGQLIYRIFTDAVDFVKEQSVSTGNLCETQYAVRCRVESIQALMVQIFQPTLPMRLCCISSYFLEKNYVHSSAPSSHSLVDQ